MTAVHPAADLFPMLDDAALDQMAADIKARGQVHPIVLTPDGVLLDGRNRIEACRRAGVEPRSTTYTGDDPTAYVMSVNLERRHLTEDERAFLALELVPLFEAEARIGRPPKDQITDTELSPLSKADRASTAKAATSAKVKPSRVRQAKRISEQAPDLIPRVTSGAISMSKAETIAKDRAAGITEGHADDWYTPRWLFESMIPRLDGDPLPVIFDLDVCAPGDPANRTVPAVRHLTADDDGLTHEWEGLVWCNPPYSQPEAWADRMVKHGDGLLLVHMPNNARWMVDAQWHAKAMVLIQSMHFLRPNGQEQRPGYSLALLAYGDNAVDLLRTLDGPMIGPLLMRVMEP